MAIGFWTWSQTASANATADSSVNYAEGQAPSSLNDSARAAMASLAKWRDDISGAIVTAGTSTAYTLSPYTTFGALASMNNQVLAFTPHATNTGAATLNVGSLGANPIRGYPGVDLRSGSLIQGTPYVVVYNNTDAVFYLQGGAANAYGIPLGAGMDYWLPTTPSSAFAFPAGQAISRVTYATLFGSMGTTYGAGDGSTTFNLPNKTERVSVMKASSASLLTSTYFGGNSTVLGAVGGSESQTLALTQMPAHDHGGTTGTMNSNTVHNHDYTISSAGATGGIWPGGGSGTVAQATTQTSTTNINHTHSITPQGAGAPHPIVQPTIVCNYILRVI